MVEADCFDEACAAQHGVALTDERFEVIGAHLRSVNRAPDRAKVLRDCIGLAAQVRREAYEELIVPTADVLESGASQKEATRLFLKAADYGEARAIARILTSLLSGEEEAKGMVGHA